MNPFTNGRIVKVDCSPAEYLSHTEMLSRSDLMQILSCPAKWKKGIPRRDGTWSTDFGSLIDCCLLQPHKLEEFYKVPPLVYLNSKGKEAEWTWKSSTCRQWKQVQEDGGFSVCTREELDEASEVVKSMIYDSECGSQLVDLLKQSVKQVFLAADYTDKETGITVIVRVMTDIVPHKSDILSKSLVDLKTARSAHPRSWRKAVFEEGYHVQGALNLDVFNASHPDERLDFRHIIVENTPPFQMARRCLSQEYVELGRMKYLAALKLYCWCKANDKWPGYRDPNATMLADGFELCEPEAWMISSTDDYPRQEIEIVKPETEIEGVVP